MPSGTRPLSPDGATWSAVIKALKPMKAPVVFTCTYALWHSLATPDIPPPGPFPIYVSLYDAAMRWPAWTWSFKLYLAASKISDDDQQRGLLQYLGGDDIQQLVPTLSNTGATFDDLAKALQDEFDKQQNKRTAERRRASRHRHGREKISLRVSSLSRRRLNM